MQAVKAAAGVAEFIPGSGPVFKAVRTAGKIFNIFRR